MADISKITLPSGNSYDLKDATAREAIAALQGGSYFLGVTTSNISDGSTTNPVTIQVTSSTTESKTAVNGNMVIKGNKEFVWYGASNTGHWVEFGNLDNIGELGYMNVDDFNNNVSTTLNTSGNTATVLTGVKISAQPTVALGTESSSATGRVQVATSATTTNIKATASGGSVAASGTADVIGSSATMTTTINPTTYRIAVTRGTDAAVAANGTATVLKSDTPFSTTVTPTTTNIKATASGTAVGADGTATVLKSDTPFATTVTPSTTTIKEVDSAGSAPTWAFSVSSETLSITGGNGSATTTKNTTVATGISSASTTATTSGHTAAALTGVKVTTQPTIALETGATAGTGVISVATGITSASTTATTSGHTAAALTGVKVSTQPVFELNEVEDLEQGVYDVMTSATASTTFNSKDQKSVVTGIGTMTQPIITLATGATAGTGVISVATGVNQTYLKATASGTTAAADGTATVLKSTTTATTVLDSGQ